MALQPINDPTCRAFERIDGSVGNALLRFVVGEDPAPRPMTSDEMRQELGDPFAALVLASGTSPTTADELLAAIDRATADDDSLRTERSFLVGEDSQLGIQSGEIESTNRSVRFLVARGSANHGPELIISASHPSGGLVEVMAWDTTNLGFNFYRTLRGGRGWVWAGNSRHAFGRPTRGKGPFESHPSGNLIMKELKFPWVHWDSFKVRISEQVFPEGDLRRQHRWFLEKSGAEICETAVVMPSIVRWTKVRFDQAASGVTALDPFLLVEHIVGCQTVNLASSSTESKAVTLGARVDLPPGFFTDVEGMAAVGLPGPPLFFIRPDMYLASLETFGFHLTDGEFSQAGDTHFAFVVPERAFEDNEVLRQALARGVVSPRLAATLLMVDFANPVFSSKRERLLQLVPRDPVAGVADISERIANSIVNASGAAPANSPERDFARRWDLGEDAWRDAFAAELTAYYGAIETQLGSQEGVDDYVRLAESRRNRVRDMPIFEFRLLFPETNLDRENVVMTSAGTVVESTP